MKYIDIKEIESIQIDHTSNCNLRCPQCARTHAGGINPELPISELSIDDYKKIFTPELIKNVKIVTQCGNYGDVVASSNILECLSWLRSAGSNASFNIMTNGSARPVSWWQDLAKIIDNKGKIVFSIDGLSDTNHIYRVGSKFDKIIENVKAFIDAGGKARWDYLIFEHNEHQIEDAKKLAKSLGFVEFNIKKTNRFITDKNYQGIVKTELKENIIHKKNSYMLKAPSEKYQAQSSKQFDNIVEKFGSWNEYINQTNIDCKFRKQKSIFVDFESRIWPCTWTASGMYHYGMNTQKTQLNKLLNYYGHNFNSLRYFSLEEILNHEWFSNSLINSWSLKINSSPIEKLMCCGRTCGSIYDFSSSSKINRETVKL